MRFYDRIRFSSVKRFLEKRGVDFQNPFFLYEARQIVRSRGVQAAICLYLLFLLGVFAAAFSVNTGGGVYAYNEGEIGARLGSTVLGLMCLMSLGVTLLYAVITGVRQGIDDELIHCVPEASVQIRYGKLMVTATLTSLFYFTTLPFLSLAWSMGGIDLLTITNLMLTMFVLTQLVLDYINAALVRVRSLTAVGTTFLGLVIAAPPWILIFVISLFSAGLLQYYPFMKFWQAVAVYAAHYGFLAILTVISLTNTDMMFYINCNTIQCSTIESRFGSAASWSWAIGLYLMFATFLLGIVFSCAWAVLDTFF